MRKVPTSGGFTLKTHQIFSVHITQEETKNVTITGHFEFLFDKNSARKSPDCQEVFYPHKNKKAAFSNSSVLQSIFEKLCFPDGLACLVGLTLYLWSYIFTLPSGTP